MIVTHCTIKGSQGWVFLTRAESPLRVTIERSMYPNGAFRMKAGALHATDSLDHLYGMLGPLLYGSSALRRDQAAQLEELVRPMLATGEPPPSAPVEVLY